MNDLNHLLEQTIRRFVQPDARLVRAEQQPLRKHEIGPHGARIARYAATFRTPAGEAATITLITKDAPLLERRVLTRLAEQGQCVPFSHTLDLTTDQDVLVCQQDLGGDPSGEPPPPDRHRQTARCLAHVHVENLGRAAEFACLPRADRTFLEGYIVADFREHLAKALARPAFVTQYGDLARQMEAAVEPFLADLDALWAAGDSLTLLHGDLHDGNVLTVGSRSILIDWGEALYGPFYLDLPNYFTAETVRPYRQALAELGHDIPDAAFRRGYHAAGRYVGFKYMGFVLWRWLTGQIDALPGKLVNQLLHGG